MPFGDDEDLQPDLVDSSDDEDYTRNTEKSMRAATQTTASDSESSISDSDDRFQFLIDHYTADRSSDDESDEGPLLPAASCGQSGPIQSDSSVSRICHVCSKPAWIRGTNPLKHHCRNYCMSHVLARDADRHSDAPSLLLEPQPSVPLLCSPLLPVELSEIAASAVKPLSRKKLKAIARKKGENPLPCLAATGDEAVPLSATADVASTHSGSSQHRERVAPAGDQMDPLIAWYSLVAKPILGSCGPRCPRHKPPSMPSGQSCVQLTVGAGPGMSPQ